MKDMASFEKAHNENDDKRVENPPSGISTNPNNKNTDNVDPPLVSSNDDEIINTDTAVEDQNAPIDYAADSSSSSSTEETSENDDDDQETFCYFYEEEYNRVIEFNRSTGEMRFWDPQLQTYNIYHSRRIAEYMTRLELSGGEWPGGIVRVRPEYAEADEEDDDDEVYVAVESEPEDEDENEDEGFFEQTD